MTDAYDYFEILLGLVFTVLFAVLLWRIGDIEYEKGYLTGLMSLAVSAIVLFLLHRGYVEIVVGHVLLFGAFWIFNVRKSRI